MLQPKKPIKDKYIVAKDGTSYGKRDLSLMLNDELNRRKELSELKSTGQIKNPKSTYYKRNVKPQAEIRQDTKSKDERNYKLGAFERPLIYLANPDKVLGDVGIPGMETSELDRQAIAANRFNPNQTRGQRLLNHAKIGLGYVPEAAVNTAMTAAFIPEGTGVIGLTNQTINPLMSSENLINGLGNKTKQFIRKNILTDNAFNRIETVSNALSDKSLKFINPQYRIDAEKALKEGNSWMDNWYNHPATIQKIDNITYGSVYGDILKQRIKDKNYTASFENNMNKLDNFLDGKPRVHKGNSGISGYNLDLYKDISRRQNLVDKYTDLKNIKTTAVHEGNHGLTDGNILISDYDNILRSPFNKDGLQERLPNGDYIRYEDYLLDPTEINARISEIRYENGLKPDQKLTRKEIDNIVDKGLKGKSNVDSEFYKLINDRDRFGWMMNKIPAAIPIAGATYLATQGQQEPKKFQQGGYINKYKTIL